MTAKLNVSSSKTTASAAAKLKRSKKSESKTPRVSKSTGKEKTDKRLHLSPPNKKEDQNKNSQADMQDNNNQNGRSRSNNKSHQQKRPSSSLTKIEGILEIMNDSSHAVIRTNGVLPGETDTYMSIGMVRKFKLRSGDFIRGVARKPKDKERYHNLAKIESVGGHKLEELQERPVFEKMTPVFPDERIKLETTSDKISTRIIDLLCPIGFGQRSMIVSQPKAGKTWLMQDIADGVTKNNPNAHLIVILVGERPEEVTDMRRNVKGEVFASNFDEEPAMNVKVAELGLERAKRLVEWGGDVVILMDSITRLARAYNLTIPTSGRTLSGGFDPLALYPPKKFFGAARNFENAGSLTIIATALVNTGSRMDDLIYEEFKGTGNMELHLDRSLSEKRIFPAIDVRKSSTRREDLLLSPKELQHSWLVRRMLEAIQQDEEPTEILIDRMKKTKSNKEFFADLRA